MLGIGKHLGCRFEIQKPTDLLNRQGKAGHQVFVTNRQHLGVSQEGNTSRRVLDPPTGRDPESSRRVRVPGTDDVAAIADDVDQAGRRSEPLEDGAEKVDVAGRLFAPVTAVVGDVERRQMAGEMIDLEFGQWIEVTPVGGGTQRLGLNGNGGNTRMTGEDRQEQRRPRSSAPANHNRPTTAPTDPAPARTGQRADACRRWHLNTHANLSLGPAEGVEWPPAPL